MSRREHIVLSMVLLTVLLLVPLVASRGFSARRFFISLLSRVLIYALAAVSLDLILGYRRHGQFRPRRVSLGSAAMRSVSLPTTPTRDTPIAFPAGGMDGHHVGCSCNGLRRWSWRQAYSLW